MPKLDRVIPMEETKGNGYATRVVRLEYGPEGKASSQVTLTLPAGPGPFPVVIGGGGWAPALVRRGYAVCDYPTSVDQVTNLPQLYPGHDFATMGQRAWTAQLVVDYLLTQPEIDRARIAINGYSRGGTMVTLAAAFERHGRGPRRHRQRGRQLLTQLPPQQAMRLVERLRARVGREQ